MLSSRGKKAAVPASKKRKGASSPLGPTTELAEAIRDLLTTDPWELFFGIIELTYLELTMELCSTFHLQNVMMNYDDPSTVQFRLGGLVHQLSVPKFSTALGLYTEEVKEENDLHALNCHIHRSPSWCWDALVPGGATYNRSRSKALALPPSLSTGSMLWGKSSYTRGSSLYTSHQSVEYSSGHMGDRRITDLLLLTRADEGTSNTVLEGDNEGTDEKVDVGEEERVVEPKRYECDDDTSDNALNPDAGFRVYELLPHMTNIDLSTNGGF
ncbi:hypothetical protein GOBAR_AA29010 [Gossypium barbadense]|uniref:Uncharacterized protein n=1 Tax=Gossypium barbadense TaxID=3634 RepID=A0A2P5WKS5_GOSBA|nr:hypothetical protein GOBAR_AA29010 [Gossypium barbadense]